MNGIEKKNIHDEQQSNRPSLHNKPHSQPDYTFYHNGISPAGGWFSNCFSFLRNRSSNEVIIIFVIFALFGIARELTKNNNLDGFALVGSLLVAAMILLIGIRAMTRDEKLNNATNTQEKNENKTAQSGADNKCSKENGISPR